MSDEIYDQLCKKYELSENAKVEFKSFFEKEIIKVFNKKSSEINKKTKPDSTGEICSGKKADGKPCTFKTKENSEYCGRHGNVKGKSDKIIRVNKESSHECHAIIPSTGKKCVQPGSVKPNESNFFYCKRHSEKWIDFEKDEHELVEEEEE